MDSIKKCLYCKNWAIIDVNSEAKGECRKHAPSLEGFPETDVDTWCGEWEDYHDPELKCDDCTLCEHFKCWNDFPSERGYEYTCKKLNRLIKYETVVAHKSPIWCPGFEHQNRLI
ncbi:hypothetical protein [Methanococcoides sp.]|jgi:hypothetical protein|uniref:hypothetical protein n=1 Tax=Methanococcoides sp. TaxID=1966350 RepID=UPI00272DFC67|nr:hypothetical protein [Methanococcoides sp.]